MRCSLCAGWIVCAACLVFAGCDSAPSAPPAAATTPTSSAPAPVSSEPPPPPAPVPLTAADKAKLIGPLLDDQTVAIGVIDFVRLDPAALQTEVKRFQELARMPSNSEAEQKSTAQLHELKQNIQQAFMVISLRDVQTSPPFTALKLAPSADPKRVFAWIQTGKLDGQFDQAKFDAESFTKGDLFVVGSPATITRLKALEYPAAIANLEPAFQLAGESAIQLIFVPADGAREPLGRSIGSIPLLQIEGPALISSIRSGVIAFDAPPALQLRLQVQTQDPSGAERLKQTVTTVLRGLKLIPTLSSDWRDLLGALTPQQEGDKLSLSMKPGDTSFDRLAAIIAKGANAAQDATKAEIARSGLKAIGLAMHSYAGKNGKLPAAYSSKNGQPLLSWRVHLLPFMEQQALYAKFKLDEPWDSEHNKALISEMPALYTTTGSNPTSGLTSFLVPRGENMIFQGDKAIGFPEIPDGTSNTMLMIDAGADKAVIWTRPDDWQVDKEAPLAGLPARFNTLWCDGATRPFRNNVDPQKFLLLLTRNDSQVVDVDALAYGEAAGGSPGWSSFSLADFGLSLPSLSGGAAGNGIMPGSANERGGNAPVPTGPDGRPLPPPESVFITQAKKAFSEGRDKEGFDFLYAEVVAGEDKDGLRKMVRWFDGAKRPAMAIRWGVAIEYTAPRNYNGGPSPVGRVIINNQGNGNSGGGGGGSGGGGGGNSSAPQPGAAPATVLDYYTAELGTKLLDGLRSRTDQGQFGEVLSVIASTPGVTTNTSNPSAPGNYGGPPPGSGPMGGDNNKPPEFKPQSLAPGVVFLGLGSSKELIARAKKEEVDALVIFAIKVEPLATKVNNTTRLALYEFTKGSKLGESRPLKATAVEVFRKENEKGTDPVEELMQKFFTLVDNNFKLGDLPTSATPDKMILHAGKLAESKPGNKLPIMVAIAYYQDQGSLPADAIAAAYGKLTDETTGQQLVGSPDERKKAMADMLPKPPPPPPAPEGQAGSGPPGSGPPSSGQPGYGPPGSGQPGSGQPNSAPAPPKRAGLGGSPAGSSPRSEREP